MRKTESVGDATMLAEKIARWYYGEGEDTERTDSPYDRLRKLGMSERDVRLFITFISAVDRMQKAKYLWGKGEKLFRLHPEVFDPAKVSSMSSGMLTGLLKAGGVTRFPGQDVKAWRTIAKNLHSGDDSPIRRLIDSGVGDAVELLEDLHSKDKKGNIRFPQLRGRKIGPMWISIMADPCQGGARIDRIDAVPVAVDVHVRRVTEYLGLASTQGLSIAKATPIIQKVWRDAVGKADIGGTAGIRGTCAALDQALWSFGREGCNLCRLKNGGYPLHDDVCNHCVEFPMTEDERIWDEHFSEMEGHLKKTETTFVLIKKKVNKSVARELLNFCKEQDIPVTAPLNPTEDKDFTPPTVVFEVGDIEDNEDHVDRYPKDFPVDFIRSTDT